jgi:hypothetical protein
MTARVADRFDPHRSVPRGSGRAPGLRRLALQPAASSATACVSTRAPAASCAGLLYSLG